jgi:hypothetical protein
MSKQDGVAVIGFKTGVIYRADLCPKGDAPATNVDRVELGEPRRGNNYCELIPNRIMLLYLLICLTLDSF